MWYRVSFLRTDFSEELIACNIREKNERARRKVISNDETSALTRATRHYIPEDGILQSHRHKNLKSYIALTGWPL
jgi:hypothetical protein